MIFKEFGNKDMPTVILLHGGGLSWWSWKPEIEALQNEYYVVATIIDGHGDDYDSTFISIKESAKQVIQYVKDNCNGKVFAICGLSIGAQITTEILSKECNITQNAVIESALVCPSKMATVLTVPMYNISYGLIKRRWFAKLQAKTLNVPDGLFESYYKDSLRMTKKTLINITISNLDYPVPLDLCKTKAKTLILVGERELSMMKRSASLLHQAINGSTLKIIKKSGHGEISLMYPHKYIKLLENFFANNTE